MTTNMICVDISYIPKKWQNEVTLPRKLCLSGVLSISLQHRLSIKKMLSVTTVKLNCTKCIQIASDNQECFITHQLKHSPVSCKGKSANRPPPILNGKLFSAVVFENIQILFSIN
jgi:hypothetical protein